MDAHLVDMNPATGKPRRAKRAVVRERSTAGVALPTAKELELAVELARRWRLALPAGYARDLAFIRAFLDVFALDGRRNPPEQVLRRLRNARQLAWDGVGADDIARKLDVLPCLGPLLHAYGLAQVPRRWRVESENDAVDGDDTLVDHLTERVLAGDDGVWAEFAVSPETNGSAAA